MLFPNISDYKNAIVIPESFATLGNLCPENGLLGDIHCVSGNFAVVFKMRDTQTGKLYAVKCFTREQERRTESLDSISRYLGRCKVGTSCLILFSKMKYGSMMPNILSY